MIVLDLRCEHGHRFEGWFASREAFAEQAERGLVECALCRSTRVEAMPSGPHVRRHTASVAESAATESSPEQTLARHLFRSLAAMARTAENVGKRFPEEARRIRHEEAPARPIRGIATASETRELLDEGIAVLPLPVPPEDELH